MGPGENAGAVDVGERARLRLQGRVAQPPERGRALPGRRHRRRRDPARHLRDRRAADRGARLAALRRAGPRARALALPARPRRRRIGHYGNSIGVPTVGGEVYFEGPTSRTASSTRWRSGSPRASGSSAARPPAPATCSSCSAPRPAATGSAAPRCSPPPSSARTTDKRPTVQVGDPFEEKKLMECSLELLERGLLVALQDLGAAGLTSSASEMASKGEVGIDIDVAKVPLREAGMEPFEIMVSESQERMLCVVEPREVERCSRSVRELGGRRRGDRRGHRQRAHARAARRRAARRHAGARARRRLPALRPRARQARARRSTRRRAVLAQDDAPARRLLALLACPNIASRRPLFEQYDSIVGSRTVRRPEQADAAVLALPDGSALARRASTATAAASPPTPTAARSRRCSSAPRTSPASAPSRSARPTTSTSATPRSRTSPGS